MMFTERNQVLEKWILIENRSILVVFSQVLLARFFQTKKIIHISDIITLEN